MTTDELIIAPTEIEIAEILDTLNKYGVVHIINVIRRLTFERDRLKQEIDLLRKSTFRKRDKRDD